MTCFVVATLLVPALIFNKIIFGLLILGLVIRFLARADLSFPTIVPFVVLCVFLFGFLLSLRSDSDYELSIQFLNSTLAFFLIYLIYEYAIDLGGIIKFSGIVMALVTFLVYAVFTLKIPFYGSDFIIDSFYLYGLGSMGSRSFSEDEILMFHLGAVPFLFLPACLFFKEYVESGKLRNILAVLLLLPAMVMSTSRGLVIAFLAGAWSIVFFKRGMIGKVLFLASSVVLAVILVICVALNTLVFSAEEPSNAVKLGHARSFVNNFELTDIFWGGGLAAYYYSEGVGKYVAHTEITLLDTIRYLGLLPALILYASLIFPVLRVESYTKYGKEYLVLFLIYLALSLTNPVLFNSFGVLVVIWYWSEMLRLSNLYPGLSGRYRGRRMSGYEAGNRGTG